MHFSRLSRSNILCDNHYMTELVFLKLGGSLITDKTRPYTARLDKLADLAHQIAAALRTRPGLSLVLGHGSGSFGHTAAKTYRTRQGLASDQPAETYWRGFAEVWFQAAMLNRHVMDALHAAGVPSLALAPVSAVTARAGQVAGWDLTPLKSALSAGLLPVVYGDVIFDPEQGGTILSTEDLFAHLARELRPQRILLAGLESAVWADFPARLVKLERISPATFDGIQAGVGASHGADVTGGMASKVRQMLTLVQECPGLNAQIFSGEQPGNLQRALVGELLGTELVAG
jgi:isopentenyl phosphate kinase